MSTNEKPISIADAFSPVPVEPTGNVEAWHLEKIGQRHKAADEGHFVAAADVQAVIRKFVPDE